MHDPRNAGLHDSSEKFSRIPTGSEAPQMLFLGRKGHKDIRFDMFDQDNQNANNYNRLVCAEAGSGMSFFINSEAFEKYKSNKSSHLAQEAFKKNNNTSETTAEKP